MTKTEGKNMKKLQLTIMTAALAAAISAPAALINIGDQLNISDAAGDTQVQGLANNLFESGTIYYGANSEGCYAGAFYVTVDNITQDKIFNLLTFCTDVGVDWNNNTTPYTAKTFSDPSSSGVAPPWSKDPQAVENAAYIYNNIFLPAKKARTLTADEAAGIQLAIWKVLYETKANGTLDTTSFSAGYLQATGFGNGITDAGTYLTDLQNAQADHTFAVYNETWLDPTYANSQGLIYSPCVPEPTTIIAGALLLLPFGASTLRGLRRNRTS